MAKPSRDRFGSSSHLHISLHNFDGKNLFPGDDFKINNEISCSNTMLHFLGGIMKYSLDMFILFAPTINSYKRFKNFSWAPSNLENWSVDNRTSPFRLCGAGKSLRIEYRIPGGDINQYLAYSALISAVNLYLFIVKFY
jgi:glutamine synthetase